MLHGETTTTIRYWALVEPELDETLDSPGGMFRLRCDVEGLHLELLTGRDVWTDAHGALAAYLLRGESGADEISEAAAARLLEQYPWPGMRRRVQSG